jgi:hypothetical protein
VSLSGERSAEIAAPVERCFVIASDIENAIVWMRALKDADVLKHGGDGRPALVDCVFDAKVRDIRAQLSFTYEPPHRIAWRQEKGDMKSLTGSWTLEPSGVHTRATYALVADPGFMLGMLLKGPAEAKVREFLLGGAADGLKAHAETRP